MKSWWKSLRNAGPRPRFADRRRLTLEALEDRLTPSTYAEWRQLPVSATPLTPVSAPQGSASSFGPIIGLETVHATTPYKGAGYSVAFLDTGIDYNHADLGGGFGAGKRVIAGYDFINNDADPMDDHGHGTHVAGIVGSSSAANPGVAPQVNLIAVKVLDHTNNGNWEDIERGLQWVVANQAKYNIVAVNLSLGSGNYTYTPYTLLEDEFASLKAKGVFTAVAAGNQFYTYNSQPGVSYPSVSAGVVSVGAVWAGSFGQVTSSSGSIDYTTAADRVVSYTQRGSNLGLLAPGAWIVSTAKGGGYKTMGGTSMATAVVTGSAVLMHQALDANGNSASANQDYILRLMQSTGAGIKDGDDENDNVTNTGLTYKRLNLQAALNAVPNPPAPPTITPVGDRTMPSGGTLTVPITATDPNGDVVTLSARVTDDRAAAYHLDQTLGLNYLGTYHQNVRGLDEKWMTGTGSVWYCLLPNGELRKWAGSAADTLKPASLIWTFGTNYYADPSLLWNAPAAVYPPMSLTMSGSTLTIKALSAWSGSFLVDVSATDGTLSSKHRFKVTVTAVTNTTPSIAVIAPQRIPAGLTTLSLTIPASDRDGDPLTYSARALTGTSLAYTTDQKYGLKMHPGGYYTNLWGKGEKWLLGAGNAWYNLMPDGKLYKWAGSMTATLTPANFIAKFDPLYYTEPRLLWDARAPGVAPLTFSFQGNRLTIQRPLSVTGVVQVEVTVSDGRATMIRTFLLTLD